MRTFIIFLVLAVISSCNPYDTYPFTHYNIKAIIEPDKSWISANVQMILVPRTEYRDSICFSLNSGLEIRSLTAQELKFYEFNSLDTGSLVLYIQEPVRPGEQLHISLSYEGELCEDPIHELDSSLFWYPVNMDSRPATFQAKFALPANYQISAPKTGTGKHGKRLYQSMLPQNSLNIIFTGN